MSTNAKDTDLYSVASRTSSPKTLLCSLACSDDEQVRAKVAENPGLPAELLGDLSCDDSAHVRICVSKNPATPVAILELLAEDYSPWVRYAIAGNAIVPSRILHLLASDPMPPVASRAKRTLEERRAIHRSSQASGSLSIHHATPRWWRFPDKVRFH